MLNNILLISMILSFVTTLIVYFMVNRNKDEDTPKKSVSYFVFIFIIFIIIFYLIIYIYKVNTGKISNLVKIGGDAIKHSKLERTNSINNIFTGPADF